MGRLETSAVLLVESITPPSPGVDAVLNDSERVLERPSITLLDLRDFVIFELPVADSPMRHRSTSGGIQAKRHGEVVRGRCAHRDGPTALRSRPILLKPLVQSGAVRGPTDLPVHRLVPVKGRSTVRRRVGAETAAGIRKQESIARRIRGARAHRSTAVEREHDVRKRNQVATRNKVIGYVLPVVTMGTSTRRRDRLGFCRRRTPQPSAPDAGRDRARNFEGPLRRDTGLLGNRAPDRKGGEGPSSIAMTGETGAGLRRNGAGSVARVGLARTWDGASNDTKAFR